MIFFLSQILPDEILRWLGGGLNSLGDSSAVGLVQTGIATIYGKQAAQGISPGKFNPTSKRNPPGSSNPSQSPRNGGGSGGSLLNGRGVPPSGSGAWGVESDPIFPHTTLVQLLEKESVMQPAIMFLLLMFRDLFNIIQLIIRIHYQKVYQVPILIHLHYGWI